MLADGIFSLLLLLLAELSCFTWNDILVGEPCKLTGCQGSNLICYFGVAGLLLSSCIADLALGFCSFANSLHWLSVPFQYTNTHHGNARYYKSGHGKLIAFALHVPDNVHLLMLFVGLWVLAILTLRLWDWINDDKSGQIPVPPCLEECWQRVQIHWAWQLLVKPRLANSHQGWGTNGQ